MIAPALNSLAVLLVRAGSPELVSSAGAIAVIFVYPWTEQTPIEPVLCSCRV